MGRITTLYGYIQEYPDRDNRYKRHNQKVLEHLPVESDWPFLNRGMFYLPKGEEQSGQIEYWGRVILLGGSFKALEDGWEEWLQKFESVLSQLIWYEARVHLITEWYGEQQCEWQISTGYSGELFKSKTLILPTHKDWTFEGPREIK